MTRNGGTILYEDKILISLVYGSLHILLPSINKGTQGTDDSIHRETETSLSSHPLDDDDADDEDILVVTFR